MKKLLLFLFMLIPNHAQESEYQFKGTHYIASYKGCSKEINNIHRTFCYFLIGIQEAGATILHFQMHPFSEISMTGTAILSESHASIHTYPEHNSVFIDLFTCGTKTDWKKFEEIMVDYLKPKVVDRKIIYRK